MGKALDIWQSTVEELQAKGYIFDNQNPKLTLQIIFPDGIRTRKVTMSSEMDIIRIINIANKHLMECEELIAAGYSKDIEGTGWAKDSILFQDWRYAWLDFDGKGKYELPR